MPVNIVAFDAENETYIRQIRNSVFVEEQAVDSAIDFDGKDKSAIHALAKLDKKPVATGRMLEDGHIGRIAVLKKYRGRGIGSKIVLSLIKEAEIRGYSRIYLGSQKHALGFYSGLGFAAYGDEYVEAGIAHLSMERIL